MFEPSIRLALGLLTGICFGFLLQKGQAAKYHVIVGQFLLRDWTVVKIMGTAVVIGSLGVHALVELDRATFHIKSMIPAGILIGGACFGIGLALLGYCPGTCIAACGEGKKDAMIGVLGMLVGAAAYVLLYPRLQPLIFSMGDFGKVTWPMISQTSPWLWVVGITILGALIFLLQKRKSKFAEHFPPSSERRVAAH